jgi:hypothetical protein
LDGCDFQATGNYGSGVFDPDDGSKLHIVICDNCIGKNADRVYVRTPIVKQEIPETIELLNKRM